MTINHLSNCPAAARDASCRCGAGLTRTETEARYSALSSEWETWTESNKMPFMSADELLGEIDGGLIDATSAQREFVADFVRRWENVA